MYLLAYTGDTKLVLHDTCTDKIEVCVHYKLCNPTVQFSDSIPSFIYKKTPVKLAAELAPVH